jgi:hypothetical protein
MNKEESRAITISAQRRGIIVPQPCQHCGAAKAEVHHPDYSKPLEVVWLCKPCHGREHARLGDRRKPLHLKPQVLHIRLTDEVLAALRAKAAAEERPAATMAARLLRAALLPRAAQQQRAEGKR